MERCRVIINWVRLTIIVSVFERLISYLEFLAEIAMTFQFFFFFVICYFKGETGVKREKYPVES